VAVFQRDWTAPPRKSYWEHIPRPSLALVAALACCSVLYMGWQRVVLGNRSGDPMVGGTTQQTPAPVAGMPTTKLPTPEQLPRPESPAPGMPVQAAQASTTEVEVPQGAVAGGMQINLVASQATWVSIIANGKPVYSGVLEPNSSRTLRGVEHARMVIGNAGGLQVTTDGRPIGPIGPPGEVRVLLLTPQGPQILRSLDKAAPAAEPKSTDPNKV
jgi:cytoskeleton protein RodZ